MDEKRLIILFERYLNNSLTPDELLELREAVLDKNKESLFDGVLADSFNHPAFAAENDKAEQAVYQNVMEAIHQDQHVARQFTEKGKFIKYRWLTGIAASLLITAGLGLFLLQKHPVVQKQKQLVNDIKPGTNKATLTLANGTQLILNDTLKGQLANESGITVSKTQKGEIVYTAAANPITGSHPLQFNTLTTAKNEQYQVILPDGSHVWLDAASSLKYPTAFTGTTRGVELAGEAYFEVAHNRAMPFKVKTSTQEVEVLGTHFNIKAYADESVIKTTLLEGSVRITLVTAPGITKVLKPGQQATGTANGVTINEVDTEESVAWKNGYFMFDDEDLGSITRKIARWYDVEISYEDPNQAKQVFAGSISRFSHVSKVLAMLEKAGNVHFKVDGRRIVVRK